MRRGPSGRRSRRGAGLGGGRRAEAFPWRRRPPRGRCPRSPGGGEAAGRGARQRPRVQLGLPRGGAAAKSSAGGRRAARSAGRAPPVCGRRAEGRRACGALGAPGWRRRAGAAGGSAPSAPSRWAASSRRAPRRLSPPAGGRQAREVTAAVPRGGGAAGLPKAFRFGSAASCGEGCPQPRPRNGAGWAQAGSTSRSPGVRVLRASSKQTRSQ